jgi:hypothetical protein
MTMYNRPDLGPGFEDGAVPDFDPNVSTPPLSWTHLLSRLLREDSRSELCRECNERGVLTGSVSPIPQDARDAQGNVLTIEFPEYECVNGHTWYAGEGAMRGIGGENPILFKEHFDSRKRREIYTACGTPDPEIVSGIYNRTHPQGRKQNSAEQRTKNGASFYR